MSFTSPPSLQPHALCSPLSPSPTPGARLSSSLDTLQQYHISHSKWEMKDNAVTCNHHISGMAGTERGKVWGQLVAAAPRMCEGRHAILLTCLPACLPVYVLLFSTYLYIYSFNYLPTTYLSLLTYYLFLYLPIHLFPYLPTNMPTYLPTYLPTFLPTRRPPFNCQRTTCIRDSEEIALYTIFGI